jgi:hypothetical protein
MFNKLVDVEEFKNVMPYFSTACKDLFLYLEDNFSHFFDKNWAKDNRPGTVETSIISSIDFP